MPRLWLALVALTVCLWPGLASATTGGDEPLEVLGFAPGEDKVYLLREIDDGGEDLPQLYYVMVDGPNAGRVVTVRSWYREFADPDVDYDAAVVRFERKLARLRTRLRDVATIAPVCTAEVAVSRRTPVADPWDPAWDTEYELQVSVSHPSAPSTVVRRTVVAFEPSVRVVAEIRIPDKAIAVVLVRWFSDPYEHGYHTDFAVGVPLGARAIAKGNTAPRVTYHPYGEP